MVCCERSLLDALGRAQKDERAGVDIHEAGHAGELALGRWRLRTSQSLTALDLPSYSQLGA